MPSTVWGATTGLLVVAGAGFALNSPGATAVLLGASRGTLPSAQGWVYLTDPLLGAQAIQETAQGFESLDTTAATSDKAGWFSHVPPFPKHPLQPPLRSATGFLVSFAVRLAAENHGGPNRAGFSVIVTGDDLSAIELAFWPGEIWVQSGPDFLHSEGVAFDTSTEGTRYDLEVRGGRYRLSAAGRRILEGDLRDCLKNNWSPATRDFVRGRGGETGASPQRAVTVEPTKASRKRPVARRVFAEKALWLRCSSITDRWWVCSLVAPRHRAFSAKTGPHLFFRQSLRRYDAFGAPYTIPEFLFLGDDSTSSSAAVEVSRVTVGDFPRVALTPTVSALRLQAEAETGRTVLFEGSGDDGAWEEIGWAESMNGLAVLSLSPTGSHRLFRARLL